MICTTTKKGYECSFMTVKGCSFAGGTCKEIVAKCDGCGNILVIEEHNYCKVFPDPKAKWLFGSCNLATHIERKTEGGKKVNPIKASKAKMRG